ncbi:Mbov_0399 family ICE element protein [Mycoplasma sp. VS299A]|uniref:Mbov_0399 family ICE element protein n=1 Tax=Mycoplasma sp. VS299A TaxID=3401690 RepID=UPI003AAA93D2
MMKYLNKKVKSLILLGTSTISTVPCFVSAFSNYDIKQGEYDISGAINDMQKKIKQETKTKFTIDWNVNWIIGKKDYSTTGIDSNNWENRTFSSETKKYILDNGFLNGLNIKGNIENNKKYISGSGSAWYGGSSKYISKREFSDNEINLFINSIKNNSKLRFAFTNDDYYISSFSSSELAIPLNNSSLNEFKSSIENGREITLAINFSDWSTQNGSWTEAYKISLIFAYIDSKQAKDYINNKIVQQYNNFVSELKSEWRKGINVTTDTGGDIYTELPSEHEKSTKSNSEYLNEEIKKVNLAIRNKLSSQMHLSLDKIISLKTNIVDNTHINLYLTSPWGDYLIYKNLKVDFIPSEYFKSKNVDNRLTIDLGKWVDFETGTTALVNDKLVRVAGDKEIKCNVNKKCYLGKYEVHTPLKISFTTVNENEVLKINGKRIDVLNKYFEEELKDNRNNANDNERVFDSGVQTVNANGEEVAKTEENSHKKNEYKIEIYSYDGQGNLDKNLVKQYEKILVINSKSIQEDFKWYAWNPDENYHQKVLISPYKIDENGNEIKDEKGHKIPNELYDASIDVKTGTKKQIIWVPSEGFNQSDDYEEYTDGSYISSWEHMYSEGSNDYNYYKQTFLPYGAKTLFKPELKDAGFIAEAVVLGKGGLKSYIGDTKDVHIFKIFSDSDVLGYADEFETDINQSSENNYFSESGLYLIVQDGKNAISNFKFVLIDEKTNPQSLFTDNVQNKYLIPFWNSKVGAEMYNFISDKYKLKDDVIFSLKYEDVMEYYKLFMNAIYNNEKFNAYIAITPLLKKYNVLTKEQFNEKFKTNETWKFNDIKDYFFDNFKGSQYVEIDNVTFDDKNNAILHLKLNSFNINHKLSSETIAIPLKTNGINKTIITLNWNANYFQNELSNSLNADEYSNKILSNKEKWFINFNDWDKLIATEEKNNSFIKLGVVLKPEFQDKYLLAGSLTFMVDITGKFGKNKKQNTKNIFENFGELTINLNGETNVEKIKKVIKEKIITYYNSLILDVDYEIKNLDTVANERKFVELLLNKDSIGSKYSTLELTAKEGKNGRVLVKVYNTAHSIYDKEIDLSKIVLNEVTIKNASNAEMLNELYTKINNQLKAHNISVPNDIDFTINSDLMLSILKRKGSFKATLIGKNAMLKNTTAINILTNIDANAKELINLNQLTGLDNLKFNENKLSVLKNKLINTISNYLFEKYYLIQNKDYKFNLNEINKTLREIVKSDNVEHSGYINIYGIDNVSTGTKVFAFSNTTDKEIEDDLVDIIDLDNIPNWGEHSYSFNSMNLLRNTLINDVIAYLAKQKLTIYKDYTFDIDEINKTIREVVVGDGKIHKGVISIYGVNNRSQGTKAFEFSNTTDKKPIDDLNKKIEINSISRIKDLSVIKGASFVYSENDLETLKSKFIEDLSKYVEAIYGIKYNIDYNLDVNELNNAIRNVSKSDGIIRSAFVKLHPLGDVKNDGYVTLMNRTTQGINDNLTNNINDKQNEKNIAKRAVWFIGIPLALLAVGASAVLGWFIYVRKYRNKVK